MPAGAAHARTADEVWAAYAARWDETRSYEAAFRQRIEISGIGGEVTSGGRFYFERPDKMLWDYFEGDEQRVVGDGRWIWVYQPELEQAYRVAYTQAFGSGGLVALLAGREGLSARYTLTLLDDEAETVRIRLTPRDAVGETLELSLSAATFDLQSVRVSDPAGSVTLVEFSEAKRNIDLDGALFEFEPPEGIDVITAPQAH